MKKAIYIIGLFLIVLSSKAQLNLNQKDNSKDSDSLINQAISLVDSTNIIDIIDQLQNMGTRFMIAPNRKEVAIWIKEKFESYNITEVYLDSFECYTYVNYQNLHYDTTTWQYNVIAKIEGSEAPEEVILLGAHYDNVSHDSDSETFAPGADDNASGLAAVFETARIIEQMNYQPKRSIEFVAFAAEEEMYNGDSGSEYYASLCAEESKNIIIMINNDMIGYDNESWDIGISDFYDSENATGAAVYILENYTSLGINQWNPSNAFADTEPFWEEGYECVYIMESIFNPYYHTSNDTRDKLDIPYCTEVVKISVGTTLLIANEFITGSENSISSDPITLFPNPSSNTIKLNLVGNYNINIIDLKGQIVLSKYLNSSENKIDISSLPMGSYIFEIKSDHQIIRQTIIKI